MLIKISNKKAISDMVSYVLLIVIAMSISVGVFAVMKSYTPTLDERQKCPENTALAITNYECNKDNDIISLEIENKGMFNVDGFYILGSADSSKQPSVMLKTIDAPTTAGKYWVFLKTGEKTIANFTYQNMTKLGRVQIQPVYNVSLCQKIVDISIEECD
jgi:hypothetical protein